MATIEFGTWSTPEHDNPYREVIAAMIDAIDKIENEDDKLALSYTLIVDKDDALKSRTLFSKAANEKGKTARVRVNAEPVKDEKGKPTDKVRFVFTLTGKHKARKGNARQNDAQSDDKS